MEQYEAEAVADALGGEIWQSGGDIYLVLVRRDDGKIVVISGDSVCLYDNENAFDDGNAAQTIELYAANAASR